METDIRRNGRASILQIGRIDPDGTIRDRHFDLGGAGVMIGSGGGVFTFCGWRIDELRALSAQRDRVSGEADSTPTPDDTATRDAIAPDHESAFVYHDLEVVDPECASDRELPE